MLRGLLWVQVVLTRTHPILGRTSMNLSSSQHLKESQSNAALLVIKKGLTGEFSPHITCTWKKRMVKRYGYFQLCFEH